MSFSDEDLSLLRTTFARQSEELLSAFEANVVALEQTPDDHELLDEIFRAAHTIKGDARMVGFPTVAEATHHLEETLSHLRDGELEVTTEMVTRLLDGAEHLRHLIGIALQGDAPAAGTELVAGPRLAITPNVGAAALRPAGEPLALPAVNPAASTTLRVEVAKLDRMLDLAGEITIGRGQVVRMLAELPHEAAHAIGEIYQELGRLHHELQEQIMQARMVAIGPLLRSYAKTVREVARSLGKDATFVVEGGDVEVDTRVLELLHDPLVHMLRNAIDHGIESPELRAAFGKPLAGRIQLVASHEAGQIVLRLSDDGQGLDPHRIAARARELGLAAQPEALSRRDLFRLIFAPGFSTAHAVTELSGRGVGMDVVRRNIEALHGTIEVESAEGVGTTLVVRLPLTLAIIDGFHVSIGSSLYVLPLPMVLECLPVPPGGRDADAPHGVIDVRGEAIPFIRLRKHFGVDGPPQAKEHAVIVHHLGGRAALIVESLFGSRQAVIKSLGSTLNRISGLAGATILDTGTVALILDVPAILADVTATETLATQRHATS